MSFLLLAMGIEGWQYTAVGAIIVACMASGYALFRVNKDADARNERFFDAAVNAKEEGFELVADLFKEAATGDMIETYKDVIDLVKIFENRDALRAQMWLMGQRVLAKDVANAERLKALTSYFDQIGFTLTKKPA